MLTLSLPITDQENLVNGLPVVASADTQKLIIRLHESKLIVDDLPRTMLAASLSGDQMLLTVTD